MPILALGSHCIINIKADDVVDEPIKVKKLFVAFTEM